MWSVADNATTLTAIGALTLLSISISFTIGAAARGREDNKELRRENALCTWRQAVLIEVMHKAEMPVPSWIWTHVPDDVSDMTPEQQRSLAREMIDPGP